MTRENGGEELRRQAADRWLLNQAALQVGLAFHR